MKLWIWILALCLLAGACRTPERAALPESAVRSTETPRIEAVQETEPPVDWESILKKRHIVFALPRTTEVVSLWDIGVRANEAGLLLTDHAVLKAYADALASAYLEPPVDAEAVWTGDFDAPFAYTASVSGVRPDVEKVFSLLSDADWTVDETLLTVPMETVPPAVTEDLLSAQHTLLASYTTSFASSTLSKANRVSNITLAANRIHGVVVQPNEVFSINKTILDRTAKNGYKMAGAINNGMNVSEYGGGVCQVSTTLFNAAMMADLEIVERYHHSWPMQYAPVGRDATIATGLKDFRFRNTSDAPITIAAKVDGNAKTVTVALYGKHSDAFDHIEIVSEQLSRLPAKKAELHLDESLPPHTKEVEREGRRGRTSVTYKDYYDADDVLLQRVTAYEDTYPSISEIAYVSADLYYK